MAKEFSQDRFITDAVEILFKDSSVILEANTGKEIIPVKTSSFISGAMLEGIVQRSVSEAIFRDKSSKAKKPSGINKDDMTTALVNSLAELRNVDHSGELFELSEELGVEIKAVRKVAITI